jgi:Cu(I)/Ag(I) efflux system membrane fusion protein
MTTEVPRGARVMNVLRWVLIAGLILGAVLAIASVTRSEHAVPGAAAEHAHDEYRCPMHPQVVQSHPGTCPICKMDLVKVAPGAGGAPASGGMAGMAGVTLSDGTPLPQPVNLVAAASRSIAEATRAVVRLEVDESRVSMVHARSSGFLESLSVGRTGERVRRGQSVGHLYSPELIAAQTDYLAALRSARALDQPAMAAAARARLDVFALSGADLARLEKTGEVQRSVDIVAPANGVVIRRDAVPGQAVDPSTTILTVGDLSRLFAVIEVPEAALAQVVPGETVEIALNAYPDAPPRSAKVVDVYPQIDARARTASVRALVNNDVQARPLIPGMFGHAELRRTARQAVMVPAEAVVDRGDAKHVFRAGPDGRLTPVPVRTGARDGADVEILDGLAPGDRVATGAVFLIDAASVLGGGGKP